MFRLQSLQLLGSFLLAGSPVYSDESTSVKESTLSSQKSSVEGADVINRLHYYRGQLKELQKERENARKLGNLVLFDDLFSHAQRIIDQIDTSHENYQVYLLLGECQGILKSLSYTLTPGKRKIASTKSPHIASTQPTKRQVLTHQANAEQLSPLTREEREELNRERGMIIYVKDIHSKPLRSSRSITSKKKNENDLNEALK